MIVCSPLFEDIDNGADHRFIKATLDRDPSSANKEEALLEFYRRLRPGDPPTIENAKGLITSLFFNPRRYDLGKVGRYKVNKRLGRTDHAEDASAESRTTCSPSFARSFASITAAAARTTSTTWATAASVQWVS